jgi:hypothetical protein
MKTKNKYNYLKVIQQHYGAYGWEDVSEYPANSCGTVLDGALLKSDLSEYRLLGYPTRVIFRKELAA